MTYNWGIEKGFVPKIPGFTVLLYCASTALLFHAATLEPMTLRPSYWKFLYSISGGRFVANLHNDYDFPTFPPFHLSSQNFRDGSKRLRCVRFGHQRPDPDRIETVQYSAGVEV